MEAIIHTGPESVEIQDRERPSPSADEVLVRVGAAGLCGSDAHAYLYDDAYDFVQLPRIMGHEYAGTVVEVGDAVSGFETGDKLVERPIQECGDCFQCRNGEPNVCQNFSIVGMHRDGAYAEYRAVDPAFAVPVPEDVPLEHAAITEPTSIATRAVYEQSEVGPGDRVLVEGPGPIGVLTALIADATGASVLVSGLSNDSRYRLPLLADLGIATVDVQAGDLDARTDAFTDGTGFDVVFDTTGHNSGLEGAARQVRKGGQVVVVGLPSEPSSVALADLVRGEVEVNTSYGSLTGGFRRALRLMDRGLFDPDAIIDTSYSRGAPETAIDDFLNVKTCKPVFTFDD